MNMQALSITLFVALCVAMYAPVTASDVVVFDTTNITRTTLGDKYFMFFYSSSSCRFCREWGPYFDAAAVLANDEEAGTPKFGKMDCKATDDAESICVEQGVDGYPAMKLIQGGKSVNYRGKKHAGTLLKFAQSSLTEAKTMVDEYKKTVEEGGTDRSSIKVGARAKKDEL